jgi:hypothetical protein
MTWVAALVEIQRPRASFGGEQKATVIFLLHASPLVPRHVQDMDGVSHTVEITAATLSEAVARGLAAIRGNEWVAEIAQTSTSKMAADEELYGMKFRPRTDR